MNEIVSWTALALGAGSITTHVVVAIAAAVKAPGGDIRIHSESTRRVFELLDHLTQNSALIGAGVALVLISAITSGTFSTSLVLGG